MKAYPFLHKHPTTGETTLSHGMELRDWFAGLSLQEFMTSRDELEYEEIAECCYELADAMIKVRGNRNE